MRRLGAFTALGLMVALAQPAARAAEARTVPDTMAQRVLACTACHGKQGVATAQGYLPRIAGKPAGYLFNQLVNFQQGRRHNPIMVPLIAPLSEPYLREIAEHFASLDLPYPSPQTTAATAAELARGEALVKRGDAAARIPACERCHGSSLMGALPAFPGLLGLPKDYLQAELGAWQLGQRHAAAPDCMADLARRLRPQDVLAVASYLSAQPVPAQPRPQASVARPLPLDCGSGLQ